MPNPLAEHIAATDISKAALARLLEVPESSVYNWIRTGSVRSPKHRLRLAMVLLPDLAPPDALRELWPDSAKNAEGQVAMWERFTDVPDSWWVERFETVQHRVDILVGSGDAWFTHRGRALAEHLAASDAAGSSPIRTSVLSAPPNGPQTQKRDEIESSQEGSTLTPGSLSGRVQNGINRAAEMVDSVSGGELRIYHGDWWPGSALWRFDSDLLLCLYLYGTRSPDSPSIRLNEFEHPGAFAEVARSFDRLWADSE